MMNVHLMWDKFPEIKDNLNECLSLIKKKTTIENKEIQAAIFDLLNSGGKLLRPAYCLIFANLNNSNQSKHNELIALAAATEVLHLATLIHDDIIDESDIRRGSQTIQSKYGQDVAVYTGDFLLAVHFELLADASQSMQIIKNSTSSMKAVLLGELEQMNNAYNIDITFDQYLKNIKGKTAQLFELSCSEGARIGHSPLEVIEKSGEIGHNIGIAFQMLDDILDYSQTEENFAKPVLEDVRQGIYSLPLILAKEDNKTDFHPLLSKKQDMTDQDINKLVELIVKYKGVEKAHSIATNYTNKALNLILELPNSPERKQLYQLTEKLLYRQF